MTADIAARLQGIIPPVVTPFNGHGKLDALSAEKLYRFMLGAGVHLLFLFGTSGEGPALCDVDRFNAVKTAVKTADGKVPVLAGAIEPGTKRVIEQARAFADLGADVLVVCTPYYFPVTQKEVIGHYRAVRAAVDLPIVAYDIPQMTKTNISLTSMLQLAREGTVIGVKDSSGDAVGFRRLLVQRPAAFRVFTGSELLVDFVLLQGADGSVPGLANAAPKLFVRLYDHWQSGRHDEAVRIQKSIVRLFEIFVQSNGTVQLSYAIGAMKAALMLRGIISECTTSAPFTPVTSEQLERTRAILSETGLL